MRKTCKVYITFNDGRKLTIDVDETHGDAVLGLRGGPIDIFDVKNGFRWRTVAEAGEWKNLTVERTSSVSLDA